MLFPQTPPVRRFFSHSPGISVWCFSHELGIRFFPAAIEIFSDPFKEKKILAHFALPIEGPLTKWTVLFATHLKQIEVTGYDRHNTFFRYAVEIGDEGISAIPQKGLQGMQPFNFEAAKKNSFLTSYERGQRLELGGYKKPLWEERVQSCRRDDPESYKEIIQALYEWSYDETPREDILLSQSLLGEFLRAVDKKSNEALFFLYSILDISLDGLLVFKPVDSNFLGYSLPPFPLNITTNDVISALSYGLKKLLTDIRIEDGMVEFHIDSPFYRSYPSGRIWNIQGPSISLSFEWRKETLRRCQINSGAKETLFSFIGKKAIESFSLRETKLSMKKKRVLADMPLHLKPEMKYLCDNFIISS